MASVVQTVGEVRREDNPRIRSCATCADLACYSSEFVAALREDAESARSAKQCVADVLMRLLVTFSAAALLLGCSPKSDRPATQSSTSTSVNAVRNLDTALASTPIPTDQNLSCSQKVLRAGDTLVLHMKTPHPEYLIVDHPDGTTFYIVYPSLVDTSIKYSYVPSDEFKNMAIFRIPSDIKANPRVLGREKGVEPLFSSPGKYVITVGEPERRADMCDVQFRP